MNRERHDIPAQGPIPETLVDAFFDRALDEGSRDRLFRAMLRDPRQAEEVARTQRALSMLRAPIGAPDVTARVLSRVEARRGFLPRRLRRLVTSGRLVGVGAVLIVVLGVALTHRWAPDSVLLTERPRPVTAFVRAGQSEAGAGARRVADSWAAVARQAEPLVDLGRDVLRRAQEPATRPMDRTTAGALTPGRLAQVRTLPPDRGTGPVIASGSGGAWAHTTGFALDAEAAWTFPSGVGPQRPGRAVGGFVGPQVEMLLFLPAEPDDPGVARWVELVGIRRASAASGVQPPR